MDLVNLAFMKYGAAFRKEAEMATEERLDKLEKELTRVKRQNRWLLAGAGVIVLTLVLARIFAGADNAAQAQGKGSEKKVIVANEFILEDEEGELRARLQVSKGGVGLSLCDKKGKPRVMMSVTEDGQGLGVYDEKDKIRVLLAADNDGAGLQLFDDKGKICGVMTVPNKGRPGMLLTDGKGNTLWRAP